MPVTWQTKYGPRKVRHDPPTLAEALVAAQGLTDDGELQVAFAADLIGALPDEVRAEMKKLAADRRSTLTVLAPSRDKAPRTVVVERKASRRFVAPASTGAALRRR